MDSRDNNHFLVQGSILAIASVIVRLIGLVYRIPMIRIIGAAGMGSYTIAFQVYNLALVLSSYSLPLAVSKLVAARRVKREYRNSYRIFICAMLLAVIVGLIACLALFFGADFFATVINDDPNSIMSIKILALTIFVFSVMGVFRGFYQGKNTMVPTAVSQVLEQVVNAVVSVSAAYILMKNFRDSVNVSAYGAAGGTLGTLAGAFVGLLFLVFVYIIYRPVLCRQLKNDKTAYQETYGDIFKLLFITIAPIILSQTVYQIGNVIDNSLFMKIMATKKVTSFDNEVFINTRIGDFYSRENRTTLIGLYGGKYNLLTNIPVMIATAIGTAIIPSITAAKVKGMDAAIKSKARIAIKFNMIIAIPSAVGMGVLAFPIIKLVFTTSYQLDANMLKLGSIAIIFYSLSTVTTAILQGINKLRVPVVNAAISLGIHTVVLIILLYFTPLSTFALVISTVIFGLIVCILNWMSLEKYMNYKQEIFTTFVIPSISSVIMGFICYFTYKGMSMLTKGRNTISTLVSLVVAVIVYFILLIIMKGINEDELSSLPKGEIIVKIFKKLHLM